VLEAGGCGEALEVAANGGGDWDCAPRGAVEHRKKKKEREKERKKERKDSISTLEAQEAAKREVAAG